ncbi:MAG TPA: hypothetical protein VFJ29_06225, partial [Candidatus Kapabacteria bacterium]|nr:hypothetical protein [Candidatus Kapabacteria bacterium]
MKRIAVSLLLFIIAVSLHAQVWRWQHPKPQGNNLNAVDFYDGNTGYAVGDNGTILKTTNGGIAWVAQQSGISTNLLTVCVSPASAQYAVAAGTNNTYVYTADGGNTWTAGNVTASNVNAGYNWRGSFFYFVNNEVFLCGDNGYIVESVDNGATFAASVRTGAPSYISNRHRSNDTLYSLAFYASSKPAIGFGIVVGSNSHVSVTSDGGNSWVDTNFVTPGFTLTGVAVPPIGGYIDGSIVGYNAQGGGEIWHTTNNGYTWSTSSSSTNFTYLGVALDDFGDGPLFAVSQQGRVATVSTSNLNWNADLYFNSNNTQLNAVSYPTD